MNTPINCNTLTSVVIFCVCLLDLSSAYSQTRLRSPVRPTASHFHVVHGWPIVPENTILDQPSAVAVDSADNVLVLQRGGRKWPDDEKFDTTPIKVPTVFVFEGRTGRLLKKWGENVFALPHSITVDRDDNVWIADVALHQVFKFTRDGNLLLQIGERAVPGTDDKHFNQPSDAAVAPDGSIFVSDGYGNSRIVKFAPDGKYLLTWGTKGKEPGQLDLPHGLTIDGDRVYVADRGNKRVQVFDLQGRLIEVLNGPPFDSVQDVKVGSDHRIYVIQNGPEGPRDTTGVLVLRPDGSLIERIGAYGNYDGQFLDAHWVAVSKSGAVYVADFEGRRVFKFLR
jgi:peptidylamidoglycolate lyase